ncbi:hypothetical protein VCBJG01_0664, partial [Vibrio cholerae BJG-01]
MVEKRYKKTGVGRV